MTEFSCEVTPIDIQRHIERGWQHFSENALVYIAAGAGVLVLSCLTLFILTGPLVGGFVYMALRHMRDGKKPVVADVVYGFQEFGTLIFYLIIKALTFIGFVLLIIPGVIFSTWWMYALVLMVDRRMQFMEAMQASKRTVQKGNGFFPHLGFIVLVFLLPVIVIHALSAIFLPFTLLNFLVFPVQILALVSAYLHEDEAPADVRCQLPRG